MQDAIAPHGGKLVNRLASDDARKEFTGLAQHLPRINVDKIEVSDLEMIAIGGFSPLEGFMSKRDYESVISQKRLVSGLPWTIPVVLSVSPEEASSLRENAQAALFGEDGTIAILDLEEKYERKKEYEAEKVYRTKDSAHPGVKIIYQSGDVCLGGKVHLVERPKHTNFIQYRLDPVDTRRVFREKGWKRIVAFQTRNPVHRAHEYLQKCALEMVDGLLLHPIVGETKDDDIDAATRMKCYEVLLQNYYPKERVVLAVNPSAMRYGGPAEAIFHAIVRKNYGCTHFIVGRDHAGVGNYYGTYDAHYIFDEFRSEELGITPLFFDHAFYCKTCRGMASKKTCPHSGDEHVFLSGTKVREMLRAGEIPPAEFTRPEVARILIDAMKSPVFSSPL
jgi:sulfate adenylyltransferase